MRDGVRVGDALQVLFVVFRKNGEVENGIWRNNQVVEQF
jgi:hypothetical protein